MLKFNVKKENCSPEQKDNPSGQSANDAASDAGKQEKTAVPPKQDRPNFGMDPAEKAAGGAGEDGWFVVYAAPFLLLLLFGCFVWPQFWFAAQGLLSFWPFEHIDGVRLAMTSNSLVAPMAQAFAPWPGHVWLICGVQKCLPPEWHGFLFPIVCTVQGSFLLLAVWGLCKGIRLGSRLASVCAFLLLGLPVLVLGISSILPHSLATAFLLLSLAAFHAGWLKEQSWGCLPVGFALVALAGLCGGLFYVLLPCLASLLFVLWRGRIKRLQDFDGLAGFVLMLILWAGWLFLVMLRKQQDTYLTDILGNVFQLPPHDWAVLQAHALSAVALVPLLVAVVGVSWWNVFRHCWADICASRTQDAGTDFLWISLVAGGLLAPFFQAELHAGIAFCLACIALPLLTKAMLNLSPQGQRIVFCALACLMVALGSVLLMLSFAQSYDWLLVQFGLSGNAGMKEMLLAMGSLPVAGCGSVILGVVMLRLSWKLAPLTNAGILMAYWCLLHQYASLVIAPEIKALLLN